MKLYFTSETNTKLCLFNDFHKVSEGCTPERFLFDALYVHGFGRKPSYVEALMHPYFLRIRGAS